MKSCGNISTDWSCSSGTKHHSVCIRKCEADFQAEAIKCKCRNDLCHWERKGRPCNQLSIPGPLDFDTKGLLETGSETGSETGNVSGEFLLRRENGQFSNSQNAADAINDNLLSQLFRDINMSHSKMTLNLNYYNNNYYKETTM